MPDLDVAKLAASLENTSANFDRHIKAEAQRRAAELGKTYAKAADERIQDNAADMQRLQDLVGELRRQMKPLTRHAYAHIALEKRLHELIAVARERGNVVPAEALFTAIGDARTVAHAKWEQEQAGVEQQTALNG